MIFVSAWAFGPAHSLYTNDKACLRTIALTGKCLQQQVAVKWIIYLITLTLAKFFALIRWKAYKEAEYQPLLHGSGDKK